MNRGPLSDVNVKVNSAAKKAAKVVGAYKSTGSHVEFCRACIVRTRRRC